MGKNKIRLTDLKKHLEEKNVSITRFAQVLGISNYGLQRILNGTSKRPHDTTILKMEDFLGLESGSDDEGIYFISKEFEDEESKIIYEKLNGLPERYMRAIEGIIDILIQRGSNEGQGEDYTKIKRFKRKRSGYGN